MSSILDYFDLNKRTSSSPATVLPDSSPLAVLPQGAAVELDPGLPHGFAAAPEILAKIPLWKQGVLYLGTFVGILFSPAISAFQAGKLVSLSISIPSAVVALVIAMLLMPQIFEKAVKDDAPFIVQLGVFVQNGVFWSVLLTTIGKSFGG